MLDGCLRLAGIIREMETLAWATIRNLEDGHVVPRVRRATLANHTRVANAERELRLRGTIADFIMSCSHAMDNVVAEAMRFVERGDQLVEGPDQPQPPASPPVPPPPPPPPPPPQHNLQAVPQEGLQQPPQRTPPHQAPLQPFLPEPPLVPIGLLQYLQEGNASKMKEKRGVFTELLNFKGVIMHNFERKTSATACYIRVIPRNKCVITPNELLRVILPA